MRAPMCMLTAALLDRRHVFFFFSAHARHGSPNKTVMSYLLKHGCHASRDKATMRAVAQDFLALAWKGGRESFATAYYTFHYHHKCDMHILKLDLESKLMAP